MSKASRSNMGKPISKNKSKPKPKPRPRNRKPKNDESSDDEWYCLVCADTYSNSKSREKWIQCYQCKGWAHEECADIPRSGMYVCGNCDSDDDIL